ncbi:MAG: iron-containing alcohol dehydrogenase [Spirochaetales bacterium]|nr:iron-containing alcohol dehydrogenase [Spirochaetales bacterium]MCF7937018.1 iron-containing alcohol dehydrogenase [Spirochaetales bacterium]
MFKTTSFSFLLPTKIEFGEGAVNLLPEKLKEALPSSNNSACRILVVTDNGIEKQLWFSAIVDMLETAGYGIEIYSKVTANPKDSEVMAIAALFHDFQAGMVVAVGGGSAIDAAKAAVLTAGLGGEPALFQDRDQVDSLLSKARENKSASIIPPLIAVPTTAGTGSEVTFSSVITDTTRNTKFTIKTPAIAPALAIIDPQLTHTLPPALTAATGMDALTHAIEAYTSQASEPISDACALHAAGLLSRRLPTAVKDGKDSRARSAVMSGSLLAGLAFSHADVGAVHCIAEALGGLYDIPHGAANSVCLPEVMEFNLARGESADLSIADRYAALSAAMSTDESEEPKNSALSAINRVRWLSAEVGLPDFSSFAVPPEDIPLIAERAASNGSNENNIPVYTKQDYTQILEKLFETGKK